MSLFPVIEGSGIPPGDGDGGNFPPDGFFPPGDGVLPPDGGVFPPDGGEFTDGEGTDFLPIDGDFNPACPPQIRFGCPFGCPPCGDSGNLEEGGRPCFPWIDTCGECPVGTYKNMTGNSPCVPCPSGVNGIVGPTTTSGNGSISVDDCNLGKIY